MHYKKSFPSKYMQAADLDAPITVTVKHVTNENIGLADAAELKPVAYFEEAVKGVVLNLTRAEALAEIAGSDDMDDWTGTRVLVRQGTTRYQGKKVACIEFAAPPRRPVQTPPRAVPASAVTNLGEAFEESSDDQAF